MHSRRRRVWMGVLGAGLLVLVGVPAGWALSRPAVDVGTTAGPAPAGSPPVASTVVTVDAPVPPVPPVGQSSARAADVRRDSLPAPVRVRMDSIALDAPVQPVGVTAATGQMEVPGDVATVGWYAPGAAPGDGLGTAVLAGHVDSRVAGRGAFFALEGAAVGDEVVVALADGSERRYQVVGRRRYPKADLPVADVFAVDGEARIALITCGGTFDTSSRHYHDNVVVYATPE